MEGGRSGVECSISLSLRARLRVQPRLGGPLHSTLTVSISSVPPLLVPSALGRDCTLVLGVLPWVLWAPYPALAFGLNSLQTTYFEGATCFLLGPASGRPLWRETVPSLSIRPSVFGVCPSPRPCITKLSEGTHLEAIHAREQKPELPPEASSRGSLFPALTSFHLSISCS